MIRKNTILLIALALITFAGNAQNSGGDPTADCKIYFRSVLLMGNPNTVNFYTDTVYADPAGIAPLWFWDFGDGETSTDQNPVHTYASDSIKSYVVTLTVQVGNYCSSSYSDIVYLGGFVPQTCSAWFTWYRNDSVMTFMEGYPVSFVDQSGSKESEIIEWSWDFGDGYTSNEQNPMHIYQPMNMSPLPPDFWVVLTIKTADGCVSSYTEIVTLKQVYIPQCQSFFYYDVSAVDATGSENLQVSFFDQSIGNIEKRFWDFGDGSSSTEESPVHTYDFFGGPYIVTLTISTDTGCISSYSDYIRTGSSGSECKPVFYYTNADSFVSIPELVSYQFFDVSEGDIIKRTWDFGDGTWSNEKSPVHNFYFQSGAVMVSLTIVTSTGCENTYSEYLYIGDPIIYPYDTCFFYINVITGENPLQDNLCNGTATAGLYDYNGQKIDIDKFYWSNGEEGISTTNLCYNNYYSVKTITASGCSVYSEFTLYDKTYLDSGMIDPGIDWTTFNDSLYYYFNFELKIDSSWICVWDFGDGQTAEGANVSHEYTGNGYYNVTLTIIDLSGVKVFSKAMEVSNATSVKKPLVDNTYYVFPNPVSDLLNININSKKSGPASVSVMDITGKTVYSESFETAGSDKVLKISVSGLPGGLYFAKIVRKGDDPVVLKFIK